MFFCCAFEQPESIALVKESSNAMHVQRHHQEAHLPYVRCTGNVCSGLLDRALFRNRWMESICLMLLLMMLLILRG